MSEAVLCDESARLQIFLHPFHKVIISESCSFDVDEPFFLKGLDDIGVQAFAMVLYLDMAVEYTVGGTSSGSLERQVAHPISLLFMNRNG